jgi:uncharacterized protein
MPVPAHRPALPTGAGTCLKAQHYADVLAAGVRPAFFEVHVENYLCAGGPAHRYLERIRCDSRLSFHGVGLSLGGLDEPGARELALRRALLDRYQPDVFSEHLAWSRLGAQHFNDLLPIAYDAGTLARVAAHVGRLQEALGRPVLIENPATYLKLECSTMDETQFLDALCERTGCGLLLDINNVVVCAANHGFDATGYLRQFPLPQVGQVHLAGHSAQTDSKGLALLIDSHEGPVQPPTWDLYEQALSMTGPLPTLVEWDSNLPDWSDLLAEASEAERRIRRAGDSVAAA